MAKARKDLVGTHSATFHALPAWASATERTLALLLAAQATQKYIPKTWTGIFFGRIITEPFAALIKAKDLMYGGSIAHDWPVLT